MDERLRFVGAMWLAAGIVIGSVGVWPLNATLGRLENTLIYEVMNDGERLKKRFEWRLKLSKYSSWLMGAIYLVLIRSVWDSGIDARLITLVSVMIGLVFFLLVGLADFMAWMAHGILASATIKNTIGPGQREIAENRVVEALSDLAPYQSFVKILDLPLLISLIVVLVNVYYIIPEGQFRLGFEIGSAVVHVIAATLIANFMDIREQRKPPPISEKPEDQSSPIYTAGKPSDIEVNSIVDTVLVAVAAPVGQDGSDRSSANT